MLVAASYRGKADIVPIFVNHYVGLRQSKLSNKNEYFRQTIGKIKKYSLNNKNS